MFIKNGFRRVNLNQVAFYQIDLQDETHVVFYSSQMRVKKGLEFPVELDRFCFDTKEEARAFLKMIDERVQVLDYEPYAIIYNS